MSFLVNLIAALSANGTGPDYSWLNNAVIVFDGNSLTAGQGASAGMDYPAQMISLLSGYPVTGIESHNYGVSAQTTSDMASDAASQVDTQINVGVENILFAWEIGNDIYFNGDVSAAETRWASYCNARKAAGWTVICINLLPRNQTSGFGDNVTVFNGKLSTANTWLAANWSTFSDAMVDIRSDSRLSDFTDSTYFSDGTHLTDAGYGVVANICLSVLLGL